jgi:hypothetical protein
MTDSATTTTVATVTPEMCAALSAEVKVVADALGTATAKSFTETASHVGLIWGKVAPIYDVLNVRWMANEKNTKRTPMTTAAFFAFLDTSGMFKLDERLTPAAVMATRHDSDVVRAEYLATGATTFVSISGYIAFLIGKDRTARKAAAGAGLTDEQKQALQVQMMGHDGAGYTFDAFVPDGVPASAEVTILLAVVNDANVRLANLKVAIGDKGYDAIVRDFGKAKASKAGIVKA